MSLPPLFFVSGAFGAGKSTLAPLVARELAECYVLDCDWLMHSLIALSQRDLYEHAESWPALGEVCLAIVASNAVAGRSSVIFSPAEPWEIRAPASIGVSETHWLLLDCDDGQLRQRLKQRDWGDELIQEALTDARRMRTLGLESVHTDHASPEEATNAICIWVRKRLVSEAAR